jgi:dCTP deaminase
MERFAIIGEREIRRRLDKDLVVSPILEPRSQIKDCSINLRLGMKIVFPRLSEHKSISPKTLSGNELLKYQRARQLSFGDEFVIHPSRLVLASTFEFVALPGDLCAFVLSRSSYGRLGLMVATATFIHPHWKGCLTLELANEGELPISLSSGESVAQLVLATCDPVPARKLTDIAFGPQFRRAVEEYEKQKLDRIAGISTFFS